MSIWNSVDNSAFQPLPQGFLQEPQVPRRTNRDRLLDYHVKIANEARQLMTDKNADYASDEDPLANLRADGIYGIMVRQHDKVARMKNFAKRGSFKFDAEKLHDLVLDMVNYAILAGFYAEEEEAKKKSPAPIVE